MISRIAGKIRKKLGRSVGEKSIEKNDIFGGNNVSTAFWLFSILNVYYYYLVFHDFRVGRARYPPTQLGRLLQNILHDAILHNGHHEAWDTRVLEQPLHHAVDVFLS